MIIWTENPAKRLVNKFRSTDYKHIIRILLVHFITSGYAMRSHRTQSHKQNLIKNDLSYTNQPTLNIVHIVLRYTEVCRCMMGFVQTIPQNECVR